MLMEVTISLLYPVGLSLVCRHLAVSLALVLAGAVPMDGMASIEIIF